jgi:glutamate N-acetyltransferase / amino-acid N-acetyltransferase
MTSSKTKFKTGITAPKGFLAAGAFVGIKKQAETAEKKVQKNDLAVVVSEVPAHAACVFTTNVVKAACIVYNQKVLAKGSPVRGIVVNSGNANACTGEAGMQHTEMMAQAFAEAFGTDPSEVLTASTGVIGVPLPIEKIVKGVKALKKTVSADEQSGHDAATAIMTTDLFAKEFSLEVEIDGKTVTIGGMAKGSGMIHPNMATMLGFVTTDANISPLLLQTALKESNSKTFNMISVDGDTSTNDMVAILANGLAGNKVIDKPGPDYELFAEALESVNRYLAKAIAKDGEGATKLLEVIVQGTKTVDDAQKLARSVISSSLVKAAFFGQDANWGRVLCALGYAGINFDPSQVSIEFLSEAGSISLMNKGEPIPFDEEFALSILKEKEIKVLVTMGEGTAQATAWGCDLSYDYVRINGSYRT